jgi:hypothetical protein
MRNYRPSPTKFNRKTKLTKQTLGSSSRTPQEEIALTRQYPGRAPPRD